MYVSTVSKDKDAEVCKGVKGGKTLQQKRSFHLQIKAAVAVRVWEQYLPFSLRLGLGFKTPGVSILYPTVGLQGNEH